jgi:hypothetical protein
MEKTALKFKPVGMTETRYKEPSSRQKKVKVNPRFEIESADFPDLAGKKIDEECVLAIRVKKVWEGRPEWPEDAPLKTKVEVLGMAKLQLPKGSSKHQNLDGW